MTAKTARTAAIIAMLSLLGLAIPAVMSQTVFAQSIADEALGGTLLDGFFDGESTEEEEAADTESQAIDQQQNPEQAQDQAQAQDQQLDQQTSQDEANEQNAAAAAGDNTGSIAQDVQGNTIEAADCSDEALICFGNDLVTDADMNQDARVHDTSVGNTATFGNDESENLGVLSEEQAQGQSQEQDQDQRALNVALRLALDGDL
ncbi:MAG: hypothetical protein M3114_06955 [Thermoproteota archaeon]|nr:hypothetical protein [Thermoproteota archaeon]